MLHSERFGDIEVDHGNAVKETACQQEAYQSNLFT